MNELCCIVNPAKYLIEGTSEEGKCHCVHCHDTICLLCATTYPFRHDDSQWFHHKRCKEECAQDLEWHQNYRKPHECSEHDVCLERRNL